MENFSAVIIFFYFNDKLLYSPSTEYPAAGSFITNGSANAIEFQYRENAPPRRRYAARKSNTFTLK
jgi:hypothetical protein